VPIGIRLAPLDRLPGSVKFSATGVLAAPATSQRPAVASVTRTVLATPGNTFWKSRFVTAVTLIGAWTVAVAVIDALLTWAYTGVVKTTSANTARASDELAHCSHPFWDL
jgi:hypothetical protein